MHPILFRIPLPAWNVPLFSALLGVAALGALVALFGWRKKAADLLLIGAVLAIGCGIAAFRFKGQYYALGSLPIYSYGAMLCLSLVVGWYLTLGLAKRDGLPRETMANCYFVTAVGALVFARLLYVVTNLDEFHALADIVNIRRGGMVAYGGFLGGFLASWLFLRMHRIRLMPWADVAVPSLASGLMITRIGCYMFGCDFGKPLSADAPGWLKKLGTFPRWPDGTLPQGAGSPAWIQHVNHRGLSPDAKASLPVHPTQLYSSLIGAFLLVLLFYARRKQKFRGEVFFTFAFAYGLLRFLLEIIRDDLERGAYGPFVSQHIYIPLALLVFAAAYCYGPARSITKLGIRHATQLASVVPAFVAYVLLKPGQFDSATPIQLSTSQWIGLLTAVGVAFAWSYYQRAAELDPEGAMALGLPAAEEEEDEEDEDEDEEVAEEPSGVDEEEEATEETDEASSADEDDERARRKAARRKRRAKRKAGGKSAGEKAGKPDESEAAPTGGEEPGGGQEPEPA